MAIAIKNLFLILLLLGFSGVVRSDEVVLTLAELSSEDVAALLGAGLVTCCIAYGLRVLRKQLGY